MKTSFLRFILPLAALAFLAPSSALAQGKGKGESSGPIAIPGGTVGDTYLIAQPGMYVLGGNRTMTDGTKPAIEINAENVTLDLGGFTLSYASESAPSQAIKVVANSNVAVRNGTIQFGQAGIHIDGGVGAMLSDLRVVGAQWGIMSWAEGTLIDRCHVSGSRLGIAVWGRATIVKDCVVQVVDSSSTLGIFANFGARVTNCAVRGGDVGITLGSAAVVSDCIVTDTKTSGIQTGWDTTVRNTQVTSCEGIGINIGNPHTKLIGNTVGAIYQGANGTRVGIMGHSTAVLANNIVQNAGKPVEGSYINAGGNVLIP